MSRSTRSSTERNGSLHRTVRCAWSLSLRCTQSTVKSRRRSWVHLKLNDQAQRTVLCKDPFKAHDERVQRLIDGM